MNHPTILQLIGSFSVGGAEKVAVSLTNQLLESGWDVYISAREDGALSGKVIEKERVCLIEKKGTFDVHYLNKLIALVHTFKIDVIQSHMFGCNLYGYLAGKITKKHVLFTIHGYDCFKSHRRIWFYKLFSPFVDKIITVSDPLKEEFSRKIYGNHSKIISIFNGIDLDSTLRNVENSDMMHTLHKRDTGPIIGTIGNVKPVKGHDVFIRSAPSVIAKYPDAKFIIVGDISFNKEYKEKLDGLIHDLGLGKHIVFAGFQENISQFLNTFDVCVVPSRSEGLSISLLEAMALSKPIVASMIEGNMRLIKDRENALLVPVEDHTSLGEAILTLLNDEALAARLSSNALKEAQDKYTLERMVESYKNLYLEIMK